MRVHRHNPDIAPAPGAQLEKGGVTFCVYAGHADSVELCLFDTDEAGNERERRIPMSHRAHGHWFEHLPGIGPGQAYGYRVHGPWAPNEGLRHNPKKLLMDPYARAISGSVTVVPEIYGHRVEDDLRGDTDTRDERDSAAYVPRSVVVSDDFDWGDDERLRVSLRDTVIYEVHVRNATRLHPGIPEHLRGTYAGLCHPAFIEHLQALGVTAVELLPVHSFLPEPFLVRKGLTNHWGYNTLGFFAPHAAYASADDPQAVLAEFKGMVKLLHAAGIEVILDVVYNHTCEEGLIGPTYAWRGLDNRAYYRLDDRGRDIDVTGCGNTLDLRHPVVSRMVLDSLRYWVAECHIDGFRFDLGVALARGKGDEYDPDHPFLVALRSDPVLGRVKLIAEPWDIGTHGWRTGQFPPPFSEWNDRFRDGVRTFWLSDPAARQRGWATHGIGDLATRLAGSADLFNRLDRGTIASINFIAAHDGFTAADLTGYDEKHNWENGEEGRDGTDNNRSWNHGVEGRTDDPEIKAARRRSVRNLLGTLLLSTGVPMINAGDEFARSQGGNNNPYSLDSPASWLHWNHESWQEDMLETTRFLVQLRMDHPVVRQSRFFGGRDVNPDGSKDLAWYAADGHPVQHWQWGDPGQQSLQMLLGGAWLGEQSLLIAFHNGPASLTLHMPEAPGVRAYHLLWDSAWERPQEADPADRDLGPGATQTMTECSMRVYGVDDDT